MAIPLDSSEIPGSFVETDGLRIRRFLTRAAEGHAEVRLWVKEPHGKSPVAVWKGQLVDVSVRTGKMTFALGSAPERDAGGRRMDLEEYPELQIQGLVFLKRGGVAGFFSEKFERSGRRLTVPMASKLFRIHRRKDERYELPRGVEVWVKLPSARRPEMAVTRRLHDVSAGGLSVELTVSEAPRYTKGLFLGKIQFRLAGRDLTLAGQVQGKGSIEIGRLRRAGVKLGVAFRRISNEDRDFIRAYVLQHLFHTLDQGF